MPFTVSHVAAVLPLRGRPGVGLPLAALAAGSMCPDLLYFLPDLPWLRPLPASHSPAGLVVTDVLFGLALWVLWRAVAPPLHDLVPGPVRLRWRPAGWPRSGPGLVAVVAAVVAGAATHVLWDEFTHPGRLGTTHLPVLAARHTLGGVSLPGYAWMQYTSGVVGLAVVVIAGLRQPVRETPPRPRAWTTSAAAWVVLGGTLLAVLLRAAQVRHDQLGVVAFAVITAAVGAAVALGVMWCALHSLVVLRASWASRGGG